jgi:hypothetical protein
VAKSCVRVCSPGYEPHASAGYCHPKHCANREVRTRFYFLFLFYFYLFCLFVLFVCSQMSCSFIYLFYKDKMKRPFFFFFFLLSWVV